MAGADARGIAEAGAEWPAVVDAATAFRRDLHRYPELAWEERETAAAIRGALDALDIPWTARAGTGTAATLAPRARGRHVALRADIDALPITEAGDVAWASTRDNHMHACGHDGHTATLLAAAAWLKRHETALPGPVTLLFQPAEEGGHGARKMIDDGALEGVDIIFGWHSWPTIPLGRAVCPDGPVMCANGTFRITLAGQGGHASQPEACKDPVLASAAVTLALQQVVSRRQTPQHATVVSVTSVDARSGETIIPDTAVLAGSIRLARGDDRARVTSLITEIARTTAAAYGVEATVEHTRRYDATVNHVGPAGDLREALAAELGADWRAVDVPMPIMASEDFSYYLRAVPGAYALVGAGEGTQTPPCHNPRFDFEDRLIPVVARVYARLAGAPLPSEASTTLEG